MNKTNERRRATRWTRIRRSMIVALGTGTMLATSCNTSTVSAVVDGIDAVTSSLDRSLSDQNQTFGQFLLNGLFR